MRLLATPPTAVLLLALAWGCADSDAAKRRYLENGNRFAAKKQYAEAILEYRNALQADDKFGEARVQLAEALIASGNPEGAYREYQRAADLMPENADVQRKAATYLFLAGQYQDVRTKTEAILSKNPKDLEAQILYANALVGLRDLEGGVREIEEAVQLDPQHASTYTNLALLRMAQGQRAAALEAFEKAVELDPKSIRARLALANFHLAAGSVAKAEQSFDEALSLDAKDPLTNRALATLYIATGRARLAEKPLQIVADVTGSPRAKFALAEYYTRMNSADKAKAVMEPMVKEAPTYAEAQTRLAQLAFAKGDREGATTQLDAVLTRQPNYSLALQTKARWLVIDGRPAQALERATAAVTAAPRDIAAVYLRGTLQALNGQHGAAIKSFNEVVRLNPNASAAQVQLAQLNLLGGSSDTAVGLASEAVARAPLVPEARLVLARALVAQREFPRADAEIGRLLAAFPRASAVQSLKGTLQLLRNDAPGARAAYQAAFDADPSSIAAVSGLTILDAREKRFAAASERLEARIKVEPKRPTLLILAGKVYAAQNNLTAAERVLRQAIDVAPTATEPYTLLGEVYRAQGRMDAARAEFDALVSRDAANVSARTMAAVLVHAQQQPAEAKRRYEELLAVEPRAAVAANNLAWIYADEKQNLDRALQLAEGAAEQVDSPEVWDTLGWVYYRKQLPILAVAPFDRAVAKDPENATFHYHLGLALTSSGDRGRARNALETALKLQPNFPDARRELVALDK